MYRNEANVQPRPPQQYSVRNTQTYYVTHDFDGSAHLTTTLAHAIADVSGLDVTETGFTLYDHVDPDALDSLFTPKEDGTPRTNGMLTFTVRGHQVSVYSDGQIAIVPPRRGPARQQ